MKTLRNFLFGLLAAALSLQGFCLTQIMPQLFPEAISAAAHSSLQTGIYHGTLLYAIESGVISITGCLPQVQDEVIVPAEIDGNPVTRITGTAFTNCTSIRRVEIPASVSQIESGAFAKCINLEEIAVDAENMTYTSVNGMLFDKHCSILLRCPGGLHSEHVSIPETVFHIVDTAFQDCHNLTEIIVPDTVTSLGSSVFAGCTALERAVLPDALTAVGSAVFSGCTSLSDVTLPALAECIGDSLFYGCTSLQQVELPQNVTKIPTRAFAGCSALKSVLLPDGLEEIADRAFSGCRGLDLTAMPEALISIGKYAFSECTAISEIALPEGFSSLGEGAFSGCTNLSSVTFPDALSTLYADTFYNCKSLRSLTIPTGMTAIMDGAFRGCTGMQNISVSMENERFTSIDGVLMSKEQAQLIYYPAARACYRYIVPETVEGIRAYAFSQCSGINTLIFPDTVRWIGESTLMNAQSICNVQLGTGLSGIPDRMFYGCTALCSVTVPSNIVMIGESAFYNCEKLSALTLSEDLVSVGSCAFFGNGLSSVSLPASVQEIGEYAFGYHMAEDAVETPISAFKISGYQDTAAETYALVCGFPFVKLGGTQMTTTTTTISTMTSTTTVTTVITTNSNTGTCHPSEIGDVSCDGVVDASDATLVLRYYAMCAVDAEPQFTLFVPGAEEEELFRAADMDGNGMITVEDANAILLLCIQRAIE